MFSDLAVVFRCGCTLNVRRAELIAARLGRRACCGCWPVCRRTSLLVTHRIHRLHSARSMWSVRNLRSTFLNLLHIHITSYGSGVNLSSRWCSRCRCDLHAELGHRQSDVGASAEGLRAKSNVSEVVIGCRSAKGGKILFDEHRDITSEISKSSRSRPCQHSLAETIDTILEVERG